MEKKNLLLSSLFFSFTLCFFAPLELYLTNRQEFWFDVQHFIAFPIILFIIVFLLLIVPGMVFGKKARCIWTSFIFSTACLIYIQGNFLNKNIGTMNGLTIEWEKYKLSFLFNWGIWFLFTVFFLILYTRNEIVINKIVSYVSVCIVLIQFFTVIVLFAMDKSDNSDRYLSMKNIYDVSTDENIIVFILDTFDDRYFDELLEDEPEIIEKFDGFTQYTNFTGGYGTTLYSMGYLLTGEYLLNQKGYLEEDINFLYENTVTYEKLKKQGYDLNIYTYDYLIPYKLKTELSNYCDGDSEVISYVDLLQNIYKLVACKYLPDSFKQHCWLVGNEFENLRVVNGEYPQQSFSNVEFYNGLLNNKLTTKENKEFKIIHLDGVHKPYNIDENAQLLTRGDSSREACTKGCIKIIHEYMNEMKISGTYDNSSIIITADHGYYDYGIISNPVLLVKPKSAHGELKFSNACISQKDFHASILSLAGLNDDLKYGYGFTDVEEGVARERFFYQFIDVKNKNYSPNRRLVEYVIAPENNERGSFHLTGYEYDLTGQKVEHFSSCSLCQSGAGETDDFEVGTIHE